MSIPIFKYEFYYNDVEIKELSKASEKTRIELTSISYNDYLTDQIDEMNITISDPTGKWLKNWKPKQKDTISGTVWLDDLKMDMGEFNVADCSYSYYPNSITLQCLSGAVPKNGQLRKKRNIKYQKTTLRTLVSSIAQKNNLILQWVGDDVDLDTAYQRWQSDIQFLSSLAREHNFFSKLHTRVKKTKGQRSKLKYLVFTTKAIAGTELVRNGETVSLTEGEGERYIEIRPEDLIGNCQMTLQSIAADRANFKKYRPYEKRLEKINLANNRKQGYDSGPSLPKFTPTGKLEGQALNDAMEALLEQTEGTLSVSGNPEFVAGSVVYFTQEGMHRGSYLIYEANHVMNTSQGWVANITLKKLSAADLPKPAQKTKKRSTTSQYTTKVGLVPVVDPRGNVVGFENTLGKSPMKPPPSYYSGVSGNPFG